MLEWHEELLCALPKAAPVPSDNTLTVVHSRSCSVTFSIYTESLPSADHWPAIYLPINPLSLATPSSFYPIHCSAVLPVGVTSPSPLLLYRTCFKSTETALVRIPADHQTAQSYGHFPSLTSPSVPGTVHSLTHRALSCNHLATWRKLEVLGCQCFQEQPSASDRWGKCTDASNGVTLTRSVQLPRSLQWDRAPFPKVRTFLWVYPAEAFLPSLSHSPNPFLVPLRITSQMNCLQFIPCPKICFWGWGGGIQLW